MEESKTTRVSKEVRSGFIVDEPGLRQIDEISKKAVAESDSENMIKSHYSVVTIAKETIHSESLGDLIQHLNGAPGKVRSLTLRYTHLRQSGIEVVFSSEGEIRVSGFSASADFQFNVNQLHEAMLTLREDRSWAVRTLVSEPRLRRWLNVLLLALSAALLACVLMYLHAAAVGVNIDPALVPKGNEYYQKIADAIRSNDTNRKLDALLLAQLSGFTNVSDVFLHLRIAIFALATGIALVLVLLGARKVAERLYPQAFYLFGRNFNVYQSLLNRRQLWGVAIVVEFIVNVIAGVVVAIMMR